LARACSKTGDFADASTRCGSAGEARSGVATFAGRSSRGALGARTSTPDCRSNTMSATVEVTSTVAAIATGAPQRRENPAGRRIVLATRCDAARILSSTRCGGRGPSASR